MKSKLILCSEWREIAKELRRQLKPLGLTVEFKSYRYDDQITVEVKRRRNADYEKNLAYLEKKTIDPWNCFS